MCPVSHATLCFLSYRRLHFLEEAINSAIAGAHQPIEIIVHEDGSDDYELTESLLGWHRRGLISTLILNSPGHNEGQGVALNRMFHMASGDPIIKADQDLLFSDGWLNRCQEILTDPKVGTLGLFKYDHEPVVWHKQIITDVELRRRGYADEQMPRGYHYCHDFVGSAMVIPRYVWETMGPFEERSPAFAEDAIWKANIDAHPTLFNALPDEDLVENVGFGIGPSTVVEADPSTGAPRVHKIHPGPYLVGGDR